MGQTIITDPGMSSVAVVVREGATLTVKDTSVAQTGKIQACSCAFQLQGTLNLLSGTISIENPSKYDKDPTKDSFAYGVWFYMAPNAVTAPAFNMSGGAIKICDELLAVHTPSNNANAVAFDEGVKGVADCYDAAVVNITGGTVDGTIVVSTNAKNITVPETVEVVYNGAVAEVDGVKYTSLADAVEAATDEQTVTLVSDAVGAGVKINKSITIDLGGFTYSFNEGVGSTGTETNGFQIFSGNTVEIKNGTLNVEEASKNEFYMLIQNYANLTLTNVTLDGTNLDKYSGTDGDSYTLSNNSGNVTINGNTNIIANDEGNLAYAFDVCKYGSYEAPVVTVNTTGKITGNIEVTEEIADNLTINSGTYTVDVSDYCADGYTVTKNADGTYGIVETNIWTTDTDAGFYMNGETKYGVLRFLFSAEISGEITESGIKYINVADITNKNDANGVKADANGASAFYGDIYGIPEDENGTQIVAVAYVTTSSGTYWSDAVVGTVDMTNQEFTDYVAGGAQ